MTKAHPPIYPKILRRYTIFLNEAPKWIIWLLYVVWKEGVLEENMQRDRNGHSSSFSGSIEIAERF
jgi:hypothetical protein